MTRYSEAGKGGDRRPEETSGSYGNGYDRIWGKKNDKTTDRAVSTVQESKGHDQADKPKDDAS